MDLYIITLTVASLSSAISLLFLMHLSKQVNNIESLLEQLVYNTNKTNNSEETSKKPTKK